VETALSASECNPDASEIPLGGIIMRLPTFAHTEKLPIAEAVCQELAHPLLYSLDSRARLVVRQGTFGEVQRCQRAYNQIGSMPKDRSRPDVADPRVRASKAWTENRLVGLGFLKLIAQPVDTGSR
jgi:hypothetical protein